MTPSEAAVSHQLSHSEDSRRRPLFDDLIRGIRLESSVAFWPEFRAPWGVSIERDWAVFHIVTQGACWLQVKGVAAPVKLNQGDFVVVTRGQFHTIRDQPSTAADMLLAARVLRHLLQVGTIWSRITLDDNGSSPVDR